MAADRRPATPLKFELQVGSGSTAFDGSHADGLRALFKLLPDALARRKALHDLERAHSGLLTEENRRQSVPAPNEDEQPPSSFMGLIHWLTPLLTTRQVSNEDVTSVCRAHGVEGLAGLCAPPCYEAIPSVYKALKQIAEANPV